jgi:hypothetical protein
MAQPTTQDPPGFLEMETSPKTKNYRADRLKLWQQLQQKHKESRETALKHGAADAAAAPRTLHGEINIFIDEFLTHTRWSASAISGDARRARWCADGGDQHDSWLA